MMFRFLVLIAAWGIAACAEAAEIYRSYFQDTPVIVVRGELVQDDVAKFRSAAASVTKGIVLLHSDGGSLYAGIEIGKAIRMRGLATLVLSQQGLCASACGFAWVAGTPRMMDRDAQVGFHAAFVIENGKRVMIGSGNALVGAYLRDLGLSDEAIYYATQARPESIRWLTRMDAEAIGLIVANVADFQASPEPLKQPSVSREMAGWHWALPSGRLPIPESAPRRVAATEIQRQNTILTDLFRRADQQEDSQPAYLYREAIGANPLAAIGQVYWSISKDALGTAINARVTFDTDHFEANITLRPNRDASVPASHIWEFSFKSDRPFGGAVQQVQRVAFKRTEQDRGNSLIAVAARITDNVHMVALNDEAEAVRANRALMLEREWVDVPIVLNTNQRLLLTFRKGAKGEGVFRQAFAEWQGTNVVASPQERVTEGGTKWQKASGYFVAGDSIDYNSRKFRQIEGCRVACEGATSCIGFSYSLAEQHCYLRRTMKYAVPNKNFVSEFYNGLNLDFVK